MAVTFKSVDGGSPKYSTDGISYYNLTGMPRMRSSGNRVSIPVASSITNIAEVIAIDVTADTCTIDETATGGTSTTYGLGQTSITADGLHDKINVLCTRSYLMA